MDLPSGETQNKPNPSTRQQISLCDSLKRNYDDSGYTSIKDIINPITFPLLLLLVAEQAYMKLLSTLGRENPTPSSTTVFGALLRFKASIDTQPYVKGQC